VGACHSRASYAEDGLRPSAAGRDCAGQSGTAHGEWPARCGTRRDPQTST